MKKGIYRHYKGKLYELLDIANHSETLEKMVVYRALYGKGETWVRPMSMWSETVNADGKEECRFEYAGDKIETEASCGAIVWRNGKKGTEYLILHQKGSGTWSFPKGHMEKGELKIDTAKREIYEETSLKADIDDNFEAKISYQTPKGKLKFVFLFLAQTDGKIKTCKDEIIEYLWADKEKTLGLLPDVGYENVLFDAEDYIKENY